MISTCSNEKTSTWTVRFTDYLKFDGVKEGINAVKVKAKQQKKEKGVRMGDQLEVSIKTIMEDGGVITVDSLSPQYDMGFGADFKFNYKKANKNYSFFVDVTAKMDDHMKFFSLNGTLVDDPEQAFSYHTEEFTLYFSVKYRHHGFFFYEKPVVSLVVQRFGNYIDPEMVDVSHSTNISNILVALHEYLMEQGYGARASHYVHPNKQRFSKEFKGGI